MKKFLKIITLAILLVACVAMVSACDSNEKDSSEKGLLCKTIGGIYTIYDYVDDGRTDTTLDLSNELGEGVADVRIKKGAFSGNNTIKELIVPSTIKTIDEGAFSGMKALEKITLPFVGESIQSVNSARTFGYIFGTEEYDGGRAISVTYNSGAKETRYMPKNLREVVINASNDYNIPMYAFSGCINLMGIELNGNIKEIGEYAFSDCKNLSEISVPATVTKICKGAFANCTSLKDTVLDSATALVEIGESAFMNANLSDVIFNANMVIGKKAFSGSTVKSVTLMGEVKVGESAFANCVKLAKVALDNVSNGEIKQFAFQGAKGLKQFGATLGTIDLTNFTVESHAFSDIFEDSNAIKVVGLKSDVNVKDIFNW